ncbi:uncharacterized protein [Elaeis guineensis]|uniref:uncharacterized protein n=1 Tax=Elaeis guineensis var. tenera TaxID=51953 RepID=UPI003C6CCFBC
MGPIHRLLHLFHSSRILLPQKERRRKARGTKGEWIPSATDLRRAGVKFRKKKDAINFLDITFDNGRMEIPPLRVTDHICFLFCNLIAFDYLAGLFVDVHRYYNSKFHKWRADFMRNYFSSPWTIISVIVAVLLLLLTIEQAVLDLAGFFYLHPLEGS